METAVVKQAKTIRDLIESPKFKDEVAKALPKHLTPDRFIRVALTAMTKTPKLANCDQASLFNSLLTLSQLGIEPDGRRAHLIPYGTTCQLIIDYKGLAELAMRSGVVSNIHADVVCDADLFEYDRGELKTHKINFREPRGPVYAVYSLVRFKDGTEKAEVMTVDEVEVIRKRSRAGSNGPWVTDWNEMAKKTVFRRLSKWLPLSPEYRDALDADADAVDVTDKIIVSEPKPIKRASKAVESADDLNMGEPAPASTVPADAQPEPEKEPPTPPADDPERAELVKRIAQLAVYKKLALIKNCKALGVDPDAWELANTENLETLFAELNKLTPGK